MANLIYSMITSLDGYTEDAHGNFDWLEPDEEVHTFVNDLGQTVGTYLFGRRMYETMVYWETAHTEPGQPDIVLDFARVWQSAEKIVYSTTLESASSAHTRIERKFNPDAVHKLKTGAEHDLTIAGPDLAVSALQAGLVDEIQQFVTPVVIGGGKRFLPKGIHLNLELLEQRHFGNGTVYLRYRTRR